MRIAGIAFALLCFGALRMEASLPVRYDFAIPEFTQKLTLGVYDSSGQLVRKLAEEAAINDFGIGLNGLIGKWDGKNDAGEVLPKGTYSIRGYALGPLQTEGVGYHFNDWVGELGETAPLKKILAVAASPHGGVYVLAEISDNRRWLGYYRSGQGLIWARELPPPFVGRQPVGPAFANRFFRGGLRSLFPARLAADDSSVAVVSDHRLMLFRSMTGGELESQTLKYFSPPVAFQDGKWVLAEGNWVGNHSLPSGIWIHALSGSSQGLLASDQQGAVWKQKGNQWSELPLADHPRVISLAWADEAGFWAVAAGNTSERLVGEFSLLGDFLKNLRLPEDPLEPITISAAPPSREIYVLRQSDSVQQLLGVRPVLASDGSAGWELFLDKKIQSSEHFGLAEGLPITHISGVPETHFTLKMVDAMTQKPQQIRLNVVADSQGVQLRDSHGLVLDTLIEAGPANRLAIQTGKKSGTLQLFIGRDGFVEEFNLRGLNQVALLDVGEIEWLGK